MFSCTKTTKTYNNNNKNNNVNNKTNTFNERKYEKEKKLICGMNTSYAYTLMGQTYLRYEL